MKIADFLAHHGINRNPFAEEDAQSDKVFQSGCIDTTRHPAWDKIYGDPSLPSTSVVFGQKGSGKTALRIQMTRCLEDYNKQHPTEKIFLIQYNDFNPFLDSMQDRFSRGWKKPETFLKNWKVWDHIDALLSLATTDLVNQILQQRDSAGNLPPEPDLRQLSESQRRDILLLDALYDQSISGGAYSRWTQLRRKLGFFNLAAWKWAVLAIGWFVVFLGLSYVTYVYQWHQGGMFARIEFWLFLLLGCIPLGYKFLSAWWLSKKLWKNLRIRRFETEPMQKILRSFTPSQLTNQPLPTQNRSDDRYALLDKLIGILQSLGYKGIVVLVDRVDEPHLINGAAPLMRDLIWPILDNKLLKYPQIGFKLLLPAELYSYVLKENTEFKERSRLDKQNTIPALDWTGESLYDMINARLAACSDTGYTEQSPETLDMFFDNPQEREHIISSLERLGTPRKAFRFLYDLIVEHANNHTDQNPEWKIPVTKFDDFLRYYLKNMS